MQRRAEVLAPVGSFEALVAAVRSGADAVYFGAKDFSARRNAENFSSEEMREAIKYCRVRGVKTYITLNIMIKDNELHQVMQVAQSAYLNGIDGFIVSDIGLAKMINKAFPEAELHASTQMSVSSPAALPILKQLGFCRVVAAREMSKKQLQIFCDAAKKLSMEVEVFVHGALCMCVSGQCLMSSVLGERSGNRGLCAGPCRLPFKASGSQGYDLSLKDLSLYSYIDELCEMGVASLKIEGRMKRPEYIAAATSACRAAVEWGKVPEELSVLLKNVFSRSGFTDGYYTEKLGADMFGTRTDDDISASKQAISRIHDIYRTERQAVGIEINAEIKRDKPIKLMFSDGSNTVEMLGDIPQLAIKAPAEAQDIISRLEKLGFTPYYSVKTQVDLDEGLFISASDINNMRRELCAVLDQKRAEIPERKINRISYEKSFDLKSGAQKIFARFSAVSQIPDNLEGVAAAVLPLEECLKPNAKTNCELIAQLPRYINDEEVLKRQLALLKEKGVGKVCCGNLASVKLSLDMGFEILGDIGLNICNEKSAEAIFDMGIGSLLLSAEISLASAVGLKTSARKGIFAYGRLPLMLLKNCPLKNGIECKDCDRQGYVTDRKNIRFPISCSAGYCELLNSKPLYLADRLNETKGIDFLLLYFSFEEKQEVQDIIKAYTNSHSDFVCEEYTRGLYYRNLL